MTCTDVAMAGDNLESGFVPPPPLDPEVKINMTLEDIIKHEKMRAGVSHNMQFKKYYKNPRGKPNRLQYKKDFFYHKRYRSQNWRLGGNGPNGRHRNLKFQTFLEQRWRCKPLNSVFHRLGWNTTHLAAYRKLRHARNFRKPISIFKNYYGFPFSNARRFNHSNSHGPPRIQKLLSSAKYYNSLDGLKSEGPEGNQPVQKLNSLNLKLLSAAVGGHITSVMEKESDGGSSVLMITRVQPDFPERPSNNYGSNRFAVNSNAMADQPRQFTSAQSYNPMEPYQGLNNMNNHYNMSYQMSNAGMLDQGANSMNQQYHMNQPCMMNMNQMQNPYVFNGSRGNSMINAVNRTPIYESAGGNVNQVSNQVSNQIQNPSVFNVVRGNPMVNGVNSTPMYGSGGGSAASSFSNMPRNQGQVMPNPDVVRVNLLQRPRDTDSPPPLIASGAPQMGHQRLHIPNDITRIPISNRFSQFGNPPSDCSETIG